MNQFMDMSNEEFKATMLTAIPITDVPASDIAEDKPSDSAPASMDWRTSGKVSPVKN